MKMGVELRNRCLEYSKIKKKTTTQSHITFCFELVLLHVFYLAQYEIKTVEIESNRIDVFLRIGNSHLTKQKNKSKMNMENHHILMIRHMNVTDTIYVLRIFFYQCDKQK